MLNIFEISDKDLLMNVIERLVETKEYKLLRQLISKNL